MDGFGATRSAPQQQSELNDAFLFLFFLSLLWLISALEYSGHEVDASRGSLVSRNSAGVVGVGDAVATMKNGARPVGRRTGRAPPPRRPATASSTRR